MWKRKDAARRDVLRCLRFFFFVISEDTFRNLVPSFVQLALRMGVALSLVSSLPLMKRQTMT